MKTVYSIFSHELSTKKRNASLISMFAIMQLLLVIALFTGWHQYQRASEFQTTTQQLVEQQWQQQPDRHPHRVAHFGHYTFRPPSALSFFDIGVNNFLGNSIFIEAHQQNSANFANDFDASSLLRFSELSVANILLLIWPLLLIAFAFNTISGEQQGGTLRQLLSLGVSYRQLFLGKSLGYLLLSLCFLAPVFIASILLVSLSGITLDADVLQRLAIMALVYLFYCLFWIIAILLVSSVIKQPRHVLALLISLWFVLTILMPRVVADYAATSHPLMKRNDLQLAVKLETKKVGDSHNPDDPYFNAFKERILAEYGVKSVEELPINYRGLVMKEGEKITAEIYQKLYQAEFAKLTQQQAIIASFYWLNPYMFSRDISMALSKSDAWHFYDYEQQSETHRYERIQKLNDIHVNHIELAHDRAQKADQSLWKEFNEFTYQQPTLTWSLKPFGLTWLLPLAIIALLTWVVLSVFVRTRVYENA